MDHDKIIEILREAAEAVIVPRFRALASGDVTEKAPGEVVTVADREAEAIIGPRLRDLVAAPVVGEEAAAEDPGLVGALADPGPVWLLDPLDGTANFVAGSPDHAVMAALVRGGETVAAWIVQPATGRAYAAERGAGAWCGGTRLSCAVTDGDTAGLRGDALTRFLSPRARAHVLAAAPDFADLGAGTTCAGVEYARIASGERHFALFHRTLPWDHAPGALLVTEAGGTVRRPDGTPYRPADEGTGLLGACDPRAWRSVRDRLAPGT
ncbi:inositol monophosphatase family protein [Streptomyces sp. NPDC001941]|uniref:inositol monophosphatase family protein n=1 Tax=Streptomyces sp. NPDC001941 TaxID=3154659 RepID=UPI00331ADD69